MTVAARADPPWGRTVTEAVVSEAAFMGFENVAVGAAVIATPVAVSAGVVAVIVGGAGVVVKLQLTGAASPGPSVAAAAVEIWAVKVVLGARSAVGSMVTRLVAAS